MGLFSSIKKKIVVSKYDTETKTDSKQLSDEEIEFLSYVDGQETDLSTFSKKFKEDYGLNYQKSIDMMIDNEYIRIGAASESLSIYKLPELKTFLKSKNLSTSGKKEILINRILTETTGYDTYFSKRMFFLTEKGKFQIKKYEEARLNSVKKDISDTISYIRSGKFNLLIPIYQINANPRKPLSIGYSKDNIIKDAQTINQYRNMGHDSDRELSIAIFALMPHKTYKNIYNDLPLIGYENITDSEVDIIRNSMLTLRSIKEFKEIGIKKYKISTCGDGRVCEKCAKHDGKKYLVSKAEPGKNAPPFCAQCRCVMIAEF